jgi:ABC-2 type transport system permease protein
MRQIISLFSIRFRSAIQYRTAAFAGLVTQIVFGFILVMILDGFYSSSGSSFKTTLSFRQVVDYIWLGQGLLAFLPWSHDKQIEQMIRTGNIAYELIKPLDLYLIWFIRALAWRTAASILRAVPLFLFAFFILPLVGLEEYALRIPNSIDSFNFFFIAILGAILLGCSITVFQNIMIIWMTSAGGIASLMGTLVTLLSGMVIPLPLFPKWCQGILKILPFRGLVDAPFRLYMGHIPSNLLFGVIIHQIIWTTLFIIIGKFLLIPGFKKLSVQGG